MPPQQFFSNKSSTREFPQGRFYSFSGRKLIRKDLVKGGNIITMNIIIAVYIFC